MTKQRARQLIQWKRKSELPVLMTFLILFFPSLVSANKPYNLQLKVGSKSSDSVTVRWLTPPESASIRVFIGPEPAAAPDEKLPLEIPLAELPNLRNYYTVKNLAAAIDVFIRIEIHINSTRQSSFIHARTTGGPRQELSTPLREIHGFAPRILQLTLSEPRAQISGEDFEQKVGKAWQKGPWQVVRADGRELFVTAVHRHSIPVAMPDYAMGYGQPYSDNILDIDHRLYLVFSEPIGSMDLLTITGPGGLSFRLPFSDRYLETPVVQLNQVGYNPRVKRRYAYVSGWMGDGGALALDDFPKNVEVLAEKDSNNFLPAVAIRDLPLNPRASFDIDAGAPVKEIDLASLPASTEKVYRIRLPGIGVSWRTCLNQAAAFRSFYVTARGLFLNRWGGNLSQNYTNWNRPADHPTVFTADGKDARENYPADQPLTGIRSLAGGYHDAGDFDQRPMHTVVPQLLMRAYETSPELFHDNQLNLPESGNGIPDLLDEALWGISAWEALQESDGGVRMGVETYRHPNGFYFANNDPLPYWTYSRDANTSARAAGLFAQAATLLRTLDPKRSASLAKRAVAAYRYAIENGASPYYLFYADGELFRLTAKQDYKVAFEARWTNLARQPWVLPRMALNQLAFPDYLAIDPQGAMPDYWLAYATNIGTPTLFSILYADNGKTLDPKWGNKTIKSQISESLTTLADQLQLSIFESSHAHRNPRPGNNSLNWGAGINSARYLDVIMARLRLGELNPERLQGYEDALSLACDYILGCNPTGLSFITGLGSRFPLEPLHLDSLSFLKSPKRQAMPGIPVFGPITNLGEAPYLRSARLCFYPPIEKTPPMLRYADVRVMVPCNEFSVWEMQAPLVALFAILIGPNSMPGILPSKPSGIDHCDTVPPDLGFRLQ